MKIGITCSYPRTPVQPKKKASLQRYLDALADAGAEGIPLWRPREDDAPKIAARADKLASQLDGILVTGGADLHPQMYGEEVNPDAKVKLVHPLRPLFETELVRAAREQSKPLLGICYGCQFFNVYAGGTLLQDVELQHPNAISHRESRHNVRLQSGSILERIIGQSEFEVASYHHQAIGCLAWSTPEAKASNAGTPETDARVAAWAPDGLIEAIELDDDPLWLGVQWHPEWDRNSAATKKLFAAFVAACETSGSGFKAQGSGLGT